MIKKQNWIKGLNITVIITILCFLFFCLFTPKAWLCFLSIKILGAMSAKTWYKGWQETYRLISSFGVITCALCIHLLLLSPSNLIPRAKTISKYEFWSFLIICMGIVVANLTLTYPFLLERVSQNKKEISWYRNLYYFILVGIPILMSILFKLSFNDIGLNSNKIGTYTFLGISIGMGGSFFITLIHCCGISSPKFIQFYSVGKMLVIHTFPFIFFCFGYSLKLLYTKYKKLGLYFLTPLLFGFIYFFHTPLFIVTQFGYGILFALCTQNKGSFLFPFIVYYVGYYAHIFVAWQTPFVTNYFVLPLSFILMVIAILVWRREYKNEVIKRAAL